MKKRARPSHGQNVTRKANGELRYEPAPGGPARAAVFDPVLCELMYRWFAPPGGRVLDPFAGTAVAGLVAAKLGRRFTGIDLRGDQLRENAKAAARICTKRDPRPVWMAGDAIDLRRMHPEPIDFAFSSPPYGDLEIYSDDPRDLSTLSYDDFLKKYRAIIAELVALLRPDRFVSFVVADVRDRAGLYRRFVSATEEAFEAAGARLYNEAILLTMAGSLKIRAGHIFDRSRKLGRSHQNVLIFVKGDPAKATAAIGPVQRGEVPERGEEAV
jgi:DNA modification methylase